MSEIAEKNSNTDKKTERVFDIYMCECGNSPNGKFIAELERRMGSKIEQTIILKNRPDKKKTLYELIDSGEIIIDEEISGGRIDRDITISSYKKDLQDDICFYIIDANSPKRGRAVFYENADTTVHCPKDLLGGDIPNYVREIIKKYYFKPTSLENIGSLEFWPREELKKDE